MVGAAPAEWIHFPKAPIKEAILDIRAKLPSSVDLDRLSTFQDTIRDHYPKKLERIRWQARIGLKEDEMDSAAKREIDGYMFISTDGKDLVQARLDGLTLNRLRPYDKWQTFRDEARKLWERYLAIAEPEAVTRVALRYINRLELPLSMRDFKDYILTTPEIAPSLPQGLKTFFMRLEIPDDRYKAIALVTETMEPPEKKLLPFIFDIDVIREAQFDPMGREIWDTFESLRNFKNEIFFNSITDKAKELFQ